MAFGRKINTILGMKKMNDFEYARPWEDDLFTEAWKQVWDISLTEPPLSGAKV